MGLTYYFKFGADSKIKSATLAAFLREVEADAKAMGFTPTIVLDASFDTEERRLFARRITTGLLIEDERLKGVQLLAGTSFASDKTAGRCFLCPEHGAVLVVTDGSRGEVVFGFFRYPSVICDKRGTEIMQTPDAGAWVFREFLKTGDVRFRKIVKRFAEAGFLTDEKDDYSTT